MKHKEAKNLKNLKKKLKKINAQIGALNFDYNKLQIELRENCPHEKTEIVDDYESGDYYNKCKYIKKLMCKTCGTELDREETLGGYG